MIYREGSVVYRVLVRNPGGKNILRGHRHKFEDSSLIVLREGGCGSVDWTDLVLDRHLWRGFVNAIMNFRIPIYGGNSFSNCKTFSL